MAFNVTYSFNNGTVTGTATSTKALRQAIYNYAHSGDVTVSTGSDYSNLTQCTLSGTAEGILTTANEQGTSTGTGSNSEYGLFQSCNYLISADLSNLSTISVTNMMNIFYGCSALTSVNLSNWDTSNTTSTRGMFAFCPHLTIVDLMSFDTSRVTTMVAMFYGCSNLEHIYIGNNWNVTQVSDSTNMFRDCISLPNFNSSNITKSMAYSGGSGYLENLAELITTAEIYYKYGSNVFKLKAGEKFPIIEVTATGSYKPSASSNSNYGACINKDGYMVIYAYSYNSNYEHYNFVNTSISATFGTIADGWNLTSTWDTSDNATHLEACTIKGIDISKYDKIKVALNFNAQNSTYDYVTCNVTITTE